MWSLGKKFNRICVIMCGVMVSVRHCQTVQSLVRQRVNLSEIKSFKCGEIWSTK